MKLAINGGKSIRTKPFPSRELYNKEIIKSKLNDLIDSDNLSGYRGSFGQHFFGGENVRNLESWFENYIFEKTGTEAKVLAVNSCTSALQIACGAIGLKAWDEVIVTPWSMTCSATAPMVYGGIPVFADIEKDYFCIDPESIKKQITKETKAIIAVDLFGQPYDVGKINEIAKKHNLFVIEDAAQALGATYGGQLTGTLGDIGCFSFTQGKHFTCGEGGFIVTKNPDLYMKCALIRNHAEAVINSMPKTPRDVYYNMVNQQGFNMRMTEMQALVLLEQFKNEEQELYNESDAEIGFVKNNIDYEINNRIKNVNWLTNNIKIDGIEWAKVRERENCTHSYYVLPFLFDEEKIGVSRNKFIEALKAELTISKTEMGVTTKIDALIWEKYITPIYDMPIFSTYYKEKDFENVTELQEKKFCFLSYQALQLSNEDLEDIKNAFYKVYNNREELK
jgi:perosamine synthetase